MTGMININGVKIRTASVHDAHDISNIEKSGLRVAWNEKMITEALNNGNYIYIVAKEDGVTVGSGGIMLLSGECEITNIAVLPEHRKRGIASAILSSLIDKAFSRGCESVFLEVESSNTAAIGLYEKFGFEPVGVRKKYYKNPDGDAMIMKKNLSESGDQN